MTVLNDLRRRALVRPAPDEVTLGWNHVRSLVEHIIATMPYMPGMQDRMKLERDLILGKVKICAVTIRVLGVPANLRQKAEEEAAP